MSKEIKEFTIRCADEKELVAKRKAFKKSVKREMLFLNCKGNTVSLKNGRRFTFIVEDEGIPADVDETLPPEAFRKAARDMLE